VSRGNPKAYILLANNHGPQKHKASGETPYNMRLRDLFIVNIKKYRKARGISQMKLAELCDTSTSYIGQIEIGNKFPSIEMIEKISSSLQIKPHLLFLDESDADIQAAALQPLPKIGAVPKRVKNELLRQLNAAVTRIVENL
jgi:transcriptional regulator with XRE-family HTH domain